LLNSRGIFADDCVFDLFGLIRLRKKYTLAVYKLLLTMLGVLPGLGSHCFAQIDQILFENISINEGLSQSIVFCITQDQSGYMWFGTEDGLNRFDGYKFDIFRNQSGNPNSLSGNGIVSMHEDKSGLLWIGTYGGGLNVLDQKTGRIKRYATRKGEQRTRESKGTGFNGSFIFSIYQDTKGFIWVGTHRSLNRFDPVTNEIVYYTHNPNDPTSLSKGTIRAIIEDKHGNLWIGTQGGGLNKFDTASEEFTHYAYQEDEPEGISGNDIITMHLDREENLWIGTYSSGLNSIDLSRDQTKPKFKHYLNDPDNPFSLSQNRISALFEDSRGNLWIGTQAGGLNKFEKGAGKFYRYSHDSKEQNSLSDNTVYAIYEDIFGVLWFGTREGINKYDPLSNKFKSYRHNPNDPFSLSSNNLRAILEDKKGLVWIGTSEKGLEMLDRNTGRFKHFTADPRNPNALQNNNIRALLEDKQGRMWIGADDQGLIQYHRETGAFTLHGEYRIECESCLGGNRVKTLFEDREGNIWIGTEGGLGVMDVKTERFTIYKCVNEDASTISGLNISSICQTKDGTMWIGTTKAGFNRFNKESGTFERYLNDPADSLTLVDNRVRCITEGDDGELWIGTLGGGLTKFDPVSGNCVSWRAKAPAKHQKDKKDGLPNDVVYGILKDDKGNLWMSTNMGISKFNPRDESFRNYDVSDGLQSNEFTADAFYKSKNGEMYFGGISGFSVFHPDSIRDNTRPPKIALNSFKIFNEEIVASATADSKLRKPVNYTDTLFLSYKDYVFSFEFAALHFGIPGKNELAYQMVGFDRDWNYVGTRKFATYTNLDPGEYTFRVKGTNNDGIWNEEGRSIHIIISPPFWETWWFRITAILVFILGVLTLYHHRVNKIKLEEKNKTILNQKFADLKLEALRSQLNPHFVFNCLNSIQGLINKKDEEAANLYLTKFSRLMRMILEYSRKPEILIKDEIHALELYLELENMRFRNKFDYQITLSKDIDVENMKISPMLMQPYVENAIKHGLMPKETKGKINISLNLENNTLHCTIQDNGVGRKKAGQLNKTQDRYHKSEGMALTKERLDILNTLKGMDMQVAITDLFDDNKEPAGTEVKIAIPIEYNF